MILYHCPPAASVFVKFAPDSKEFLEMESNLQIDQFYWILQYYNINLNVDNFRS